MATPSSAAATAIPPAGAATPSPAAAVGATPVDASAAPAMAAAAAVSAPGGGAPAMDFASVLAKIQSLEREKADMRAQLENVSGKLSKLQESKRAEMQEMLNTTISKWLENLNMPDTQAKDQLRDGLNRLVQSGDETGVWNVVACASSNWVHNVNQIETLTQQLNEYKEKERLISGGLFQSEDTRMSSQLAGGGYSSAIPHPNSISSGEKRKADFISSAHGATSRMPGDIWGEFEDMLLSSGGNKGADYGILVGGTREGSAPSGDRS